MTRPLKRRRTILQLEALEQREAPATLVGLNKVTYQDIDGDNVTVSFSKPILNSGNVNSIFTFGLGNVNGSNALKQRLLEINLVGVANAAGSAITTSAVHSSLNGGDGFAALGHIDATGIDLGGVTIDGDLGRILAGDATMTTSGLKGLTVQSMGRFGTTTGAPNLNSVIQGRLDFLKVKSDVKDASIVVQGGTGGRLGSVFIGGSVLGGGTDFSGRIAASGDMGPVVIQGDLVGSAGADSGAIEGSGKVGGVHIGGSLTGGAGDGSGRVFAQSDMGQVDIGGSLLGGGGLGSGEIEVIGKTTGVRIGGSLKGGTSNASGRILSTGILGAVVILGDLVGTDHASTGVVSTAAKLVSARIGGSVIGGAGNSSGQIQSTGDMGLVTILGNVTGAGGNGSGEVISGAKLAGATVGGSVAGGAGIDSARITSDGDMGFVTISENLIGGGATDAGEIRSGAKLAGVKIGGSLQGGSGVFSGRISSWDDLGLVTIVGNLIGASGDDSGEVHSDAAKLAGVKIGGSVQGGAGKRSGRIFSGGGDMGFVTIQGSLIGAGGTESGEVLSNAKLAGLTIGGTVQGGAGNFSGRIRAGETGQVTIQGSLIGAAGVETGEVRIDANLAGVKIGGSVVGGAEESAGAITSAGNVGTIVIGGDIIGGSAQGSAQLLQTGLIHAKRIGSLTLGGSLIAGTDNTTGGFAINGAIRVDDDLGTVLIKGSIIGNATNPAIISARGKAVPTTSADVAIGSLTVLGRVEFGQILAGVSLFGAAQNADAQIGTVNVGGDWIASSIAAGVLAGINTFFGDTDDVKISGAGVKDVSTISSRIASLVIGGEVLGTIGGTDNFGVVAENIGAVRIGGTPLVLALGNGNDDVPLGITGDFRVNEI